MSIKEFAEVVRKELEARTNLEVQVKEVLKNNGVILHGIMIANKESNIAATIYLEPYYARYDLEKELDYVLESILDTYEASKIDGHIDLSWFSEFESAKEKIAFKLINFDSNQELLADVPFTKYLDLAKVYYVNVEHEGYGRGTILIHNNHMEEWGITVEQLESIATENTPKLNPVYVLDIKDILETICAEVIVNTNSEEVEYMSNHYPMYAITNQAKRLGALYMCDKSIFKKYADKFASDIIILPSSTHEIIILPKRWNADIEQFKDMVREVNNTQVDETEVLSYSVYIYSRETDSISIA